MLAQEALKKRVQTRGLRLGSGRVAGWRVAGTLRIGLLQEPGEDT